MDEALRCAGVADLRPRNIIYGAAFADYCGDAGILVHYTDSASPWQNGRTERAGGLLKDQMKTMFKEMPVESETDLELYLTSALDARNRFIQRSGFSAHQRVFGSAHRLPACLLADDPIDRFVLATNAGAEMQRANAVRAEAQRALFRQNDVSAIRRAWSARNRTQPTF